MSGIVWLGGVAFAASLSYLIYFYAILLAPSAPPDEGAVARNISINVALFAAFALHHSLFARTSLKARIARVLPRYERSLYVWIASALLVTVCVLWRSLPGVIYEVAGAPRWLLYGVQLTGALLVIRAARVVDPLDLAGIRQATGRERAASLKIVGPFRFVRHPIYLGWMLVVFGAPTMTTNRLVFALITSLYLIIAIGWEERSLIAAHGDEYRAYQRAVRFRVLPGLW